MYGNGYNQGYGNNMMGNNMMGNNMMGNNMMGNNMMGNNMMGNQGYGNYRNRNWGGYQMQTYSFNQNMVGQYAQQIFLMYDRDRSGNLEMHEFPAMCQAFFQMIGMSPPTMNDIMFLMYTFDSNGDGRINFMEFRNMLAYLGGQRNNMNRSMF